MSFVKGLCAERHQQFFTFALEIKRTALSLPQPLRSAIYVMKIFHCMDSI